MSERKIEKVTVSSCICIRMSSKPKSADQSGDLRNRATTVQQDKTVAEISMKDFLDFLKISYQVNEAIDKSSPDFIEKNTVNWEKLTANELINRLKGTSGKKKKKIITSLTCFRHW